MEPYTHGPMSHTIFSAHSCLVTIIQPISQCIHLVAEAGFNLGVLIEGVHLTVFDINIEMCFNIQ